LLFPDGRSFVTGSKKALSFVGFKLFTLSKANCTISDTIFTITQADQLQWLESNSGSGKEIKFNVRDKTIRYVRITPDRNRIVSCYKIPPKYLFMDLEQIN
jgi:hypothetical protein